MEYAAHSPLTAMLQEAGMPQTPEEAELASVAALDEPEVVSSPEAAFNDTVVISSQDSATGEALNATTTHHAQEARSHAPQ